MKWLVALVFVVVLVVAISAAVLTVINNNTLPGSENRPDGPSLHIVNNSSQTICKVQTTHILESGSLNARTFDGREIVAGKELYYEVGAGFYDLAALNCNGDLLAGVHNAEITDSYTWTITD